jgi:hypothetical protein
LHSSDKKTRECNLTVAYISNLYTLRQPMSQDKGRLLCNIQIEFFTAIKIGRLIKLCLNESYSKVRKGKHLPHAFYVKNGTKE